MASTETLKPSQLTLHATIKIDPTNTDKFLTALRPAWAAVINEPECLFFDVFHTPEEPGTFRFVEVWTKDWKWFLEHQMKKAYYQPYLAITEPMWLDRELKHWERADGWSYVDDKYLADSIRTGEGRS